MLATGFLCLPALAAAKPVDDSAPSSLAVPPVGSDTPRGSDDAASRPKATARYDDGRPPLIVMKGERHAGTNFLTGILETSLGDIRVTGGGSAPDPMTSCNPFAPEPPRTYCCSCDHLIPPESGSHPSASGRRTAVGRLLTTSRGAHVLSSSSCSFHFFS